jgi:phospholipid/cholesterol/gamma-HCH transport system ATP-binding protein
MIVLENLVTGFGTNRVLDKLSLSIEDGQTMVVIGPSGCGKSVLLKCIMGLLKVESGRILVNGKDVTTMARRELYELRKRFGMVFQSSALFDSLTVGENVSLALREHTGYGLERIEGAVAEKLDLVGLSGTQHLKPAELSGGMKKRVAIARAIVMDPDYVLYDEPTTGLDPITADRIDDLIRDLQSKLSITSIAVTHDMKSAYKIADTIAMLHDGRISFTGTPDETRNTGDPVVRQFIEGRWKRPQETELESTVRKRLPSVGGRDV